MRPHEAFGSACALVLLGTVLGAARAEEGSLFQECCGCRRPVVAAYAPPCTACYPVTAYYEAPRRCGPIRRLLGRCCLVPVCRPSCAPPPCPPPCGAAVLPAAPVVVPPPAPGPTAVPNAIVPVPQAPPGSEYERNITPVPQTPSPPLTGSSYRPQRPIAPVPAQRLTPPQTPPPVRLDRIVSEGGGPVEAVPATLTRPLPPR